MVNQFSARYWLKPPSKGEAKGNISRWHAIAKKQSRIIHRVFIVTITDVKRPSSLLEAVECLETASLLQGLCTCMFSEVCTQFQEKPAYWTMKRRFVLHLIAVFEKVYTIQGMSSYQTHLCISMYQDSLVLCPTCARLPARNGLVNQVKFFGAYYPNAMKLREW